MMSLISQEAYAIKRKKTTLEFICGAYFKHIRVPCCVCFAPLEQEKDVLSFLSTTQKRQNILFLAFGKHILRNYNERLWKIYSLARLGL